MFKPPSFRWVQFHEIAKVGQQNARWRALAVQLLNGLKNRPLLLCRRLLRADRLSRLLFFAAPQHEVSDALLDVLNVHVETPSDVFDRPSLFAKAHDGPVLRGHLGHGVLPQES